METEVRFYFSLESEKKILKFLKWYKEIKYLGIFYEKTDQYNHPMEKYNFYNLKVDGRFRVRQTIGDAYSKCMITWKRRISGKKNSLIHEEEEVEVEIKCEEYNNIVFLLTNVIHLDLVESYERYRSVFKNEDVEIVVDRFPFGIAIEIENKSTDKDSREVITNWTKKLGLKLEDAYKLSWDDKYSDLCKAQNKEINNIVRFDGDMPFVLEDFKPKL